MIYKQCIAYRAPHGRCLQAWFKTGSRLIQVLNDLWIVTDDGGALLFTEVTNVGD